MKFGLNFFPSVGPADCSPAEHYHASMELVDLCDPLGFIHVRQVEHHFHPYGGYSPNPIVFLAAAAQRTSNARLMTGAVLPVFNHPLKLAGELAMLDGLSNGRLDIGFARAFVPHEFDHFGISMDESRDRFVEGVAQVMLLLEHENASHQGRFHSFSNVTVLPRLTQERRPPVWIAASSAKETFEMAGREGYNLMFFGMPPERLKPFLEVYREGWSSAGHEGAGSAMVSMPLSCSHSRDEAIAMMRPALEHHKQSMIDSTASWLSGRNSADYPGYGEMLTKMKESSFDEDLKSGAILAGTPDDIVEQVQSYCTRAGGIDCVSLHSNPGMMPIEFSKDSLKLFASEAMNRLV